MHKNAMGLAGAGNGVGGGWNAPRYKAPKTPGTTNPKDIGYLKTPLEQQVFMRHQRRRAWEQHTRADGKLTEIEVQKILAAREKRARKATRQAKGIRCG